MKSWQQGIKQSRKFWKLSDSLNGLNGLTCGGKLEDWSMKDGCLQKNKSRQILERRATINTVGMVDLRSSSTEDRVM